MAAKINRMAVRAKLSEIPPALHALLKEKTLTEQLIRQSRWGQGVVTLIASHPFISAGMGAAYAFESLLGWPMIVRAAAEYNAYSAQATHPRSIALVISPSGEEEEALEAAQSAARRGARVLAITANAESALARAAQGVFHLPGGPEEAPFLRTLLVLQTELAWITL
ncbi:MAG TPA: SIS domain-containing protein, partial [Terriglobia bacterium]|nr:SIS domain-containing protein [Terriglobia bacterium]